MDYFEQLAGEIREKEAKTSSDKRKLRWCHENWPDSDNGIAPVKQMLLLLDFATADFSPQFFTSAGDLASALHKHAKTKSDPTLVTNGGPARRDGSRAYTETAFRNALLLRNSPNRAAISSICKLLIEILQPIVENRGRTGTPLNEVFLTRKETTENYARALFGSLHPTSNEYSRGRIASYISPIFDTPPSTLHDQQLIKHASDTLHTIRRPNGPRLIQYLGTEQSGRFTTIQLLLARLEKDRHLKLTDGTRMPTLAIAVDEFTPYEFVTRVHAFYRGKDTLSANFAALPTSTKLEEIGTLAKRQPALVIVVGTPSPTEHEVIQSLNIDLVSRVLIHILQGHAYTRLIVTSNNQRKDLDHLGKVAKLQGLQLKQIEFDPSISICYDAFALAGNAAPKNPHTPIPVRRRTLRLAEIVGKLIRTAEKRPTQKFALLRHRNIGLHNDDQHALIRLAWNNLYSPEEKLILGVIASSHDGLRKSVLMKMMRTIRRISADDHELNLSDDSIESVLQKRTGDLISARSIILDHYIPNSPPDQSETLHFVDRVWRPILLSCFFHSEWSKFARLANWLIAREACFQSQIIKLYATNGRSSLASSFGREVQSLHALVASIDVHSINDEREDTEFLNQAEILAPLELDTPPPTALQTVRFAFTQISHTEFNEGIVSSENTWDDAKLRLSLLLPLFVPDTPWKSVDERSLEPSWKSYPHLIKAFNADELGGLLTAVALAAQRMQRFDLVGQTVRLAEELTQLKRNDPTLSPASLFRAYLAETDLALFIGGNPDSLLLRAHGRVHSLRLGADITAHVEAESLNSNEGQQEFQTRVGDIVERLQWLINHRYEIGSGDQMETLLVRAKIYARLGATFHAAGRFAEARQSFEQAMVVGAGSAVSPANSSASASKVFGGKSARSYIRFLLDEALRFAPPAVTSPAHTPLPRLRKLSEHHENLTKAKKLQLINLRRLSTARTADHYGARIDEARIAAALWKFGTALKHLDDIVQRPLPPNIASEKLLEAVALRTSILITTVRWLELPADGGGPTPGPEFELLLRMAREHDAESNESPTAELRKRYLKRAAASHTSLVYFTAGYPPGFQFRIISNYLAAWIDALSITFDPTNLASDIEFATKAEWNSKIAMREMLESGYRMNLREASELRSHLTRLRKSLQRPTPPVPGN